MKLTFKINRKTRADRIIAEQLPYLRRAVLEKLFRKREIKIDGKPVDGKEEATPGSEISVFLPDPHKNFGFLTGSDIVFEDEHIIAFNKRAGAVVQPGTGTQGATLVEAAQGLLKIHVALVHRLDRDTSGIIVMAKTHPKTEQLENAFRKRTTEKTYHAVVLGHPQADSGVIKLPLKRVGERIKITTEDNPEKLTAETAWEVVERRKNGTSLLLVKPKTGRMHQIRVHLATIGYPIVGDTTYGQAVNEKSKIKNVRLSRHLLHASNLKICGYNLTAPLPIEFTDPS